MIGLTASRTEESIQKGETDQGNSNPLSNFLPISRAQKENTKIGGMAAQIKHQKLGQIQGRLGDGVVQFLGIKYATLKDRFAGSELVEYDGAQSVIDATKLGRVALSKSWPASD